MTEKNTNEEEVKETEEQQENNKNETTPANETVEDTETSEEKTEEKTADDEVREEHTTKDEIGTEINTTESETLESEKTSEMDDIIIIADATTTDSESEENLNDENFLNEDLEELEDEAPQGKLTKHMGKILYTLLGIVIVAVLLFSYYVFPFYSKIGGTWSGTSQIGEFKLVNKGSKSEFTIVNMNNIKGMDLVFTSQLNRQGVNEYGAKDTAVTIVLNKKKIPEEQIKQFKDLKDQVKVKSESKKEVVLTYTDSAYKAAFSGVDVNSYFNYRLANFNFALQGKNLMLKNKDFASTEITFTHK